MTKVGEHEHDFNKPEYEQLDRATKVTNPNFVRMNKPVMKLLVCECGMKIAVDLLSEMPDNKEKPMT